MFKPSHAVFKTRTCQSGIDSFDLRNRLPGTVISKRMHGKKKTKKHRVCPSIHRHTLYPVMNWAWERNESSRRCRESPTSQPPTCLNVMKQFVKKHQTSKASRDRGDSVSMSSALGQGGNIKNRSKHNKYHCWNKSTTSSIRRRSYRRRSITPDRKTVHRRKCWMMDSFLRECALAAGDSARRTAHCLTKSPKKSRKVPCPPSPIHNSHTYFPTGTAFKAQKVKNVCPQNYTASPSRHKNGDALDLPRNPKLKQKSCPTIGQFLSKTECRMLADGDRHHPKPCSKSQRSPSAPGCEQAPDFSCAHSSHYKYGEPDLALLDRKVTELEYIAKGRNKSKDDQYFRGCQGRSLKPRPFSIPRGLGERRITARKQCFQCDRCSSHRRTECSTFSVKKNRVEENNGDMRGRGMTRGSEERHKCQESGILNESQLVCRCFRCHLPQSNRSNSQADTGNETENKRHTMNKQVHLIKPQNGPTCRGDDRIEVLISKYLYSDRCVGDMSFGGTSFAAKGDMAKQARGIPPTTTQYSGCGDTAWNSLHIDRLHESYDAPHPYLSQKEMLDNCLEVGRKGTGVRPKSPKCNSSNNINKNARLYKSFTDQSRYKVEYDEKDNSMHCLKLKDEVSVAARNCLPGNGEIIGDNKEEGNVSNRQWGSKISCQSQSKQNNRRWSDLHESPSRSNLTKLRKIFSNTTDKDTALVLDQSDSDSVLCDEACSPIQPKEFDNVSTLPKLSYENITLSSSQIGSTLDLVKSSSSYPSNLTVNEVIQHEKDRLNSIMDVINRASRNSSF